MSAHTPGEWVIHGRSGPTRPIRVGLGQVGPRFTLAHVMGIDGASRAEVEANARLIAACPAMYSFVEKRAAEGDAEAVALLASIRPEGK